LCATSFPTPVSAGKHTPVLTIAARKKREGERKIKKTTNEQVDGIISSRKKKSKNCVMNAMAMDYTTKHNV